MTLLLRPAKRLLLLAALLGLASSASAVTAVVAGRRLLVNGTPFTVKGVCYSPIPPGNGAPYDWSTQPSIYLNDFPLIAAMGATAIRTYDPITQQAAMDALTDHGLYVIMGFDVPAGTDITVPANRTALINGFVAMVNQWRNHPAALMWVFGNEVIPNNASANANPSQWFSLLQQAAAAARAVDPNHPVTTANVDINNIGVTGVGANDASLPDVGLWGINSYRGATFGNLFTNFAAASNKPMVMLEFGADASNGAEDQATQNANLNIQWTNSPNGIAPNLSATNASNVCVGGTVFEFTDEWWKFPGGNFLVHDTTATLGAPSYADREEWFGIMSVLPGPTPTRNPRTAYATLRSLWGGTAPMPNDVPEVLNIYSDAGIAGINILTWSPGGAQFDGNYEALSPPEGRRSFRTAHNTWAGWGVDAGGTMNLEGYRTNGALKFWIWTNTADIKIEFGRPELSPGVPNPVVLAANLNAATVSGWTGTGHWSPVQINLNHANFSAASFASITMPFQITSNSGAEFYVDRVRLVRNRTLAMTTSVVSRANGQPASGLTFPSPAVLPAGWLPAQQYVRVDLDPGSNFSWGLQIYTDNTNAAVASPLYGGAVGTTDPAGLIDNTNAAHTARLPLAWHVSRELTTDLTPVQTSGGALGTAGGRQFHWMKDRLTPDIPATNTLAFANGQDAVTVWDELGFHFAPGDKTGDYWGTSWGAVRSPLYLYFAAGFGPAINNIQYRTGALMVEYFSE